MSGVARRAAAITTMLSLALLVQAPIPVEGLPAFEVRQQCERPDERDLRSEARTTVAKSEGEDNGPPSFTAWFSDEAGQEGVVSLNSLLEPFDSMLVGVAPDNIQQVMLIVLDRAASSSISEISKAMTTVSLPFPVEIVLSCYPKLSLEDTSDELAAGLWAADLELEYSIMIDPLQGRVVIVLDGAPDAVSAAKQRTDDAYGDKVLVIEGQFERDGRYDDGSPHYGGASIQGAGLVCTANATIVGIYGFRFMPTAGHCSRQTGTWTSGPHQFAVGSSTPDFPEYDMGLLVVPPGHVYTNKIHTEPGAPLVRTVIGQRNAGANEASCMSGQTSHARCDLLVVHPNNDRVVSDAYGTTMHLDAAWVDLANPNCQPGDSGAPMYQRVSPSSARVQGLHVGSFDIPAYGVRECFYHDAGVVTSMGNYLVVP